MRHLEKLRLWLLYAFFGLMQTSVTAAVPTPPGPFSECTVVNYKEVGATTTAGKSRLATAAAARSSATDAVKTQTWIVRSASATNVTYAVKQTLLGSGEVELCSYTPNRVLATLEKGKSEAAFRTAMSAKGLTVKYELMKDSDGNSVFVVEAADTENDVVETMTASIQSTGFCSEKVYQNTVYSVCSSPNDPAWSDQWNMEKIGAPAAWDATTDASGVTVAVLDTGINYNNYDLNENLWMNPGEADRGSNGADDDGNGIVDDIYGISCIGGNVSGNPLDDRGHGSHCAGIIGAVGNNNFGVAGIAWNAKIMALKFCDSSGHGSLEDVIRCLNYADDKGARVINCSWVTSGHWDILLADRIKVMGGNGVIFVCAAGNAANGESPIDLNEEGPQTFPACFTHSNIVTVAATDRNDALASFSFWGKTSVDIAAPGVDVYSTVLGSMGLDYDSGTSMAAPHVTGALALLMAYYPEQNSYELVQKLYDCGEDLDSLKGKVKTGKRLSLKELFGLRAPTGADVTASLGTSSDAVSIYWNAVQGATFYRVWRAESADGEKTLLRDWHAGLTFSDTTAEPEKQYYYFVQAAGSSTGASASPYSTGVIGYRAAASTGVKVTFNPAGGSVSTAMENFELGGTYGELPVPTYAGQVFLGWYTAATGGTRIDASCAVRAEVTGLFAHWISDNAPRLENLFARQRYPWNGYVDVSFSLAGIESGYAADVTLAARSADGKTTKPLKTWVGDQPVELDNGGYRFVWNSAPDVGTTLNTNLTLTATITTHSLKPNAPSNVQASQGTSTNGVVVTWEGVAGVPSYEILRSLKNEFSSANVIAATQGISWTDGTAGTYCLQVTNYYYWVRSVLNGQRSDAVGGVMGYRQPAIYAFKILGQDSVKAGEESIGYMCVAQFAEKLWCDMDVVWTLTDNSNLATMDAVTSRPYAHLMAAETSTGGQVMLTASYVHYGHQLVATKTVAIAVKNVTVSFNGNGGTSSVDSQVYTVYDTYGSLPTATRTGYTFSGWYTASSGGTLVTTSSTVPASTTTLYAHWTVITPTAPTGVGATDGTYSDKVVVSWTASSGATAYFVYRNTSNSSGGASLIGSSTSTSYNDTTAVPGTTYYYWVIAYRSDNGQCSVFSSSDSGSVQNPAAFTMSISGSPNATYGDRLLYYCVVKHSTGSTSTMQEDVALTWSIIEGSDYASISSAGVLSPKDISFSQTVIIQATYTEDGEVGTATKTVVVGPRPANAPKAPTNVSATQGASTDGITITWSGVSNATSYGLYRSTTDDALTAVYVGGTAYTSSSYMDTSTKCAPGVVYYYWLKTYSSTTGYSDFSASASGYRKLSAPTGVTATDGTSTSGTTISWSSVSGATKYYVYRYTSNSSSSASSIGSTTSTSYTDTTGTAGTTYCYWVKAYSSASSSYSAFSSSDSGYREIAVPSAPTGVSATDGTSTSGTTISWSSVSGATKYYVYRYTSNSSSYASSIGSTTSTSYTDTTGTAGTTYYYWVKAYNSAGYSSFSSYDTGYKKKTVTVTTPSAPTAYCLNEASGPHVYWSTVDGATSYKVYLYEKVVRTSGTQEYYTLLGTTTSTSYYVKTIGGVSVGTTTYSFRVKAVNSAGESGYSNVCSGHKLY